MSLDSKTLYRSAVEHSVALNETREYTAVELAEACLARAEACVDWGAFLALDRAAVIAQARASDDRRAAGKALGPLDGIPIAIKDNICAKGATVSCASRMLKDFVAPYDATVIEKLRAAGAVLMGRANMDEFAMGSSTENSAFQNARNPWNPERVPGGSSGGSAVAVAAGIAPLALGSDTGGSIRQPAAFCGVVGLKPTYGRVSRYGLVAYASSLDQIGPFARSVADTALVLETIAGADRRDSTSLAPDAEDSGATLSGNLAEFQKRDWSGLSVGVMLPDDEAARAYEPAVLEQTNAAVDFLKKQGAQIVPLKSRLEQYLIPIYYILATAEASSNLSRYDGVRYGQQAADAKDLMDLYVRSRTAGFGDEVKRRILLGTFVLSSGYYDAYYKSAQKARRLITKEYAAFFERVDVILAPTSPSTAFALGDKVNDPIAMYQSDILTIAANLTGNPAVSIPAGADADGLPVGLQLMTAPFREQRLLEIAGGLAAAPGFALDYASIAAPATSSGSSSRSSKTPAAKVVKKPAARKTATKTAKTTKKAGARTVKKTAKKPAAKKTAKKVAKKTAKKAAKQAAKKAAKKTVSKAAQKTARKPVQKPVKKPAKKPTKKPAKKPTKKPARKR